MNSLPTGTQFFVKIMSFLKYFSALCDNEQDAIQLALGSFYPNLLLSGIIWPLEGMLPELRYLSYILPQTYACEAMRGIYLDRISVTSISVSAKQQFFLSNYRYVIQRMGPLVASGIHWISSHHCLDRDTIGA